MTFAASFDTHQFVRRRLDAGGTGGAEGGAGSIARSAMEATPEPATEFHLRKA
jgi:hypothetical protein